MYRVVIIDSLNGYMNAMPEERFLVLQMHELLSTLNQLGVITILVLAQHGLMGPMQTPLDISYLSDAVLMLRYFEAEGRVRRAISVVKKRSGAHEDAIREFRLTARASRSARRLPSFRAFSPACRIIAAVRARCSRPKARRIDGERALSWQGRAHPGARPDGPGRQCRLRTLGASRPVAARPCSGLDELQRELESGAGAAVIAEEAFLGADAAPLFSWVRTSRRGRISRSSS